VKSVAKNINPCKLVLSAVERISVNPVRNFSRLGEASRGRIGFLTG